MATIKTVKKGNNDEVVVEEEVEDKNSEAGLTKLELDIIRQIEYYFSENNMRRDRFLMAKVTENDEGWVDISVLLTFNRLKTISDDAKAIADAVRKSNHGLVEVSEDSLKLRRHPENPLPEFNETRRKDYQARTAYAKGFPLDFTITTLIDYFHANFENVEQVQMRKYFCPKTKTYLFKGSVFVTFKSRKNAEEFVSKPDLKYKEKDLLRYTQVKYIESKKKEREDFVNKKKAKREAKKPADEDKVEFTLPKSAVVHFAGAESEITREDIKASIAEIDAGLEVAFINFQKGDKDGDLRFNKENDASKLMEKLEGGKLTVKECELTFNLIEGDEETKFLEKAIEDMKQRRNKFQKGGKGGRGKQHFTRKRRNDEENDNRGKRARTGRD